MSRYLVELHDAMFPHAASAGGPLPWPDLPFRWDRSGARRDVAVFTDISLEKAQARKGHWKVAWMLESPRATRKEYRWLGRNAYIFDRVLTFEQSLLETLPHAKFCPLGGCWLREEDWKVHHKTRNLSVIASHKQSMPGQKLRHKLIRRHAEAFDVVLGRGYREISNKIEGLAEFRYSLAIENCRQNYYFSEKLIDCLLSGTVPIYWGCPSIGLFFDKGGIIALDHPRELGTVLQQIGPEDYERRLPAIRRNLELAKRFVYPESHVWENIRDLQERKCVTNLHQAGPDVDARWHEESLGHVRSSRPTGLRLGKNDMSAILSRLKATGWYKAYRNWRHSRRRARELRDWERNGRPVPPPAEIKRRVIRQYAERYGLKVLVETGTYRGDTVDALKSVFDRIYSIELSAELFERAKERFKSFKHIELIHGDSGEELGRVVNKLDRPALFYLDGHYSAGDTARGKTDTPIYEELHHILNSSETGHVILIDDARCFGSDPAYPSLMELTEFIRARRSNSRILVEDDSIRITPS